jgi:DNA-binding NtrC family response regulator
MNQTKKLYLALVDDDPDEEDFFQIALDFLGIDCQFDFFSKAHDFVAYIEKEETTLPDIVFVDMNMPEINGQELIRKLRNNSKYDAIQAVIYTAHISDRQKEEMMEMGTFEFFIKPTEFAELTLMMKEMIERKALK